MDYTRQIDIFSKEHHSYPICIVGAGATGSFVALALAKMGMNNIKIWDFDKVETHNFPNQIFRLKDLDGMKAEKTAEIVDEFTGTKLRFANFKFDKQQVEGIVVLAVDSMKVRKAIYERCKQMEAVKLVLDPRAGGEAFRIYTVDMALMKDRELYEATLYSDNETSPIPCTAQAIIYSVLMLSACICSQVKRWLMKQQYFCEVLGDSGNLFFLTK